MGYDLDTRPGGWVMRQALRRQRLVWAGIVAGMLLSGLMIVLAFGHWVSVGASLLVLALFLVARRRFERYVDGTLCWLRGAQAEQAVGETLNELRRVGWIVMHDLPQTSEGNVDHLASGPAGVYVIETKHGRYEPRQLVKVKRQAARLHDELGVWVTPVICLHERRGEPFRTSGVWIVPHRHLLDWLQAQSNRPVAFERLARFADRIGVARDWR